MAEQQGRARLDAVMPLLAGDLPRAVLQARTLRHFFRRDDVLHLHVVCRAAELADIRDVLGAWSAPWLQYGFHEEESILAGSAGANTIGRFRQQAVKLAAAEWLGAPFWLTLDADVICTKPVGVADLLPGGRALLQYEPVQYIDVFNDWAFGARFATGSVAPPSNQGVAITPMIFAAPIAQAFYAMVEFAHGKPWKEALLGGALLDEIFHRGGQGWSENLLYFAAAARSGWLRQYHAIAGIDTAQKIYSGGIWEPGGWKTWDAERAFDRSQPGFFEICSSYVDTPVEFVSERIAPFLSQSSPAAPPLVSGFDDDLDEAAPTLEGMRVRVLSRDPLIVMGPYDTGILSVAARSALLPFRDKPALVVLPLSYSHEDPQRARQVAARLARRQREAPLHQFLVLCNTDVEMQNFRELGVPCHLVSHNAMINERPFMLEAPAVAEFDAVYNATFHPMKRHALAAGIGSLALIFAHWHDDPEFAPYVAQSRQALSHAVFLNQPTPADEYRFFGRDELARQLSRARVGLSLSEEEGAHRASIEYLFLGLPVVSTFNRGGRDLLLDGDFCATVPAEPQFVAGAVRALIERGLSRDYVRRRTLAKIAGHRERYVEALMRAAHTANLGPLPPIHWPWLNEEVYAWLTPDELHARLA